VSRVAYVNGEYVPHRTAAVHIEDRGYQFADGVYEVCAVLGGKILDLEPHLNRLARSLNELSIARPMSWAALKVVMAETVRRNKIRHGMLYIQITRGVARRDHPFPAATPPSLVMTARAVDFNAVIKRSEKGIAVITLPDMRWQRRDIKSIALLPNILAKQAAKEAGAYEAWQVDPQGFVTEGSSTNAWIVTKDGALVTRSLSHDILPGITRQIIIKLAAEHGLKLVERDFTVAEAMEAREAFLTSTTAFAMPVVRIDSAVLGNGHPGSVCRELIRHYWAYLRQETGISREDFPEMPV
jgi:D-alanine transaminase